MWSNSSTLITFERLNSTFCEWCMDFLVVHICPINLFVQHACFDFSSKLFHSVYNERGRNFVFVVRNATFASPLLIASVRAVFYSVLYCFFFIHSRCISFPITAWTNIDFLTTVSKFPLVFTYTITSIMCWFERDSTQMFASSYVPLNVARSLRPQMTVTIFALLIFCGSLFNKA